MRKQIRIAELTVAVDSDGRQWDWDSQYACFEVQASAQDCRSCPEDILLHVHWHGFDGQDLGEELAFIAKPIPLSAASCRVYRRTGGSWLVETDDLGHQAFARRVAVLNAGWDCGDLFVDLKMPGLLPYSNPLCPPLDRLLFANFLARQPGLLLHTCGVVYRGQGYLFAGASGTGKTTMARLWSDRDDVTVLGEECMALRFRGSEPWAYGTPWIGETRSCSAQGAPLAGIFFLHHARENQMNRRPVGKVVEGLLNRSFVPAFDPIATHQVLDFCVQAAQSVPAYDFGFRPDASAVEFIQMAEQGGRIP
jgi:hypothetical protein